MSRLLCLFGLHRFTWFKGGIHDYSCWYRCNRCHRIQLRRNKSFAMDYAKENKHVSD